MLSRFVRTGTLRVIDAKGREHVHGGAAGPEVTIRITDPRLYWSLFLNPELRAGEAYMDETLLIEDGSIRDLLMLFALNRENLRGQPLQKSLRRVYKRIRALHQRNTTTKARANIAHHYDLSNDMYRLFLDDDLNYTCAYFLEPDEPLEAAQRNKLRHVAAKLALEPGQRVLDAGCGWGAMSLYLAEQAEVDVVGVTLSADQHALATARARERGLDDRVRFEHMDFRDVSGKFDRIVSIGMLEHFGVGHHAELFSKLDELLTDDGVAVLHSIGRMGGPGTTAPWLRKYIFPGGYAPALSEALGAAEQAGFWVTDLEVLRLHYAETLLAWDKRFQSRRAEAAALLDERFCRMWEFYLIAAEVSFRYGKQMVFHMQLTKSVDTLPIARDYIAEAEAEFRRREAGTESGRAAAAR